MGNGTMSSSLCCSLRGLLLMLQKESRVDRLDEHRDIFARMPEMPPEIISHHLAQALKRAGHNQDNLVSVGALLQGQSQVAPSRAEVAEKFHAACVPSTPRSSRLPVRSLRCLKASRKSFNASLLYSLANFPLW